MTDMTNKRISRRAMLKGSAAALGLAAGSGAITGFPTIWAQSNITLRQFGTGVSNLNAIAEKCKADLGITLEMTATDSDAAAQRAVTQPDSYDIADIEYPETRRFVHQVQVTYTFLKSLQRWKHLFGID